MNADPQKLETEFKQEQNFEISLNKQDQQQSNGAILDAEFAALSKLGRTQPNEDLLKKLLSYSLNEFTKPAIL